MGTKYLSRNVAQAETIALWCKKQSRPITLQLQPPRNPVVFAMAHGAGPSGAGKHIRSQGAVRRADRVSLKKQSCAMDC